MVTLTFPALIGRLARLETLVALVLQGYLNGFARDEFADPLVVDLAQLDVGLVLTQVGLRFFNLGVRGIPVLLGNLDCLLQLP